MKVIPHYLYCPRTNKKYRAVLLHYLGRSKRYKFAVVPFAVLEFTYWWCSRGIWQMPWELKKGVKMLCRGRCQEVQQWDLDSPSQLQGKRMNGWAGKADFLVYSVHDWHLDVWECGLFNWLLAPVPIRPLNARRLRSGLHCQRLEWEN